MKFLESLLLAASVVNAASQPSHSSGALYFLDNNPEGASIVSFKVEQDGSLGNPEKTSTGGKGLISKDANGTVSADPVFSQDSVVVVGKRLFTVNPGSNTVASFYIPENDPTHPVLLGEPVDSVGDVPNSVAYSQKHNVACVANTGSMPGAQCYTVSSCGKLEPQGNFKPLPVHNQTVPPMGPANTVSNVAFNPSESALFAFVKGDGMEDGYVYAYQVMDGTVSDEPVKSRLADVPTAFGSTFISDSSAVVTTPAFGAVFVDVAYNLSVTVNAPIKIDNQSATCWAVWSDATMSMYILDGGVANITALDPGTKEISRTIPGFQDGMGNFDGIVGGSRLYALQASPNLAIYDLENLTGGPEVVDLKDLGDRAAWTGMAIYMH